MTSMNMFELVLWNYPWRPDRLSIVQDSQPQADMASSIGQCAPTLAPASQSPRGFHRAPAQISSQQNHHIKHISECCSASGLLLLWNICE